LRAIVSSHHALIRRTQIVVWRSRFPTVVRSKREGIPPETANATLTMPKYLRLSLRSTIRPTAHSKPVPAKREISFDETNLRLHGLGDELALHVRVLLSQPQLIAGGTGRTCEQTTVTALVFLEFLQGPLAR
jgi:hypothetical protein